LSALRHEAAIDPTCREEDHGEHQRQFREFCDPGPTAGTNQITRTAPSTKPAAKTIAKYTADEVSAFMENHSIVSAPAPRTRLSSWLFQ
jgi:hypothetical protein